MNLSELTTLRVGGPAAELLSPTTPADLVEATRDAWATGEEWLVLGGGSNVLIGDEGFDGSVIRVLTRGIEEMQAERRGRVRLRVQAGEPWDALVATAVGRGLSGIEALSGIPGSSGAAPVQNIGAYGQEVASSLVAVDFLDYATGERRRLETEELDLGYRSSALKQGRRGLVISIDLELGADAALGEPVEYPQLAAALGVEIGARLPVAEVRAAVLALRASKGMVLDPGDPDSASAGSFFTNPIVSERFAGDLPPGTPRWPSEDGVKLSAAWLIERSGIPRGFRLPGSQAAVSSKHTLAIVNAGGATAAQIAELARYLQTRVLAEFGVVLQPEPILVGVQL